MSDKERRSLDDRLAGSMASVALILGGAMVIAGAWLAAAGRPEPSLIWAGAFLVIAAVLGDRILSLELGTQGGKITLAEKRAAVEAVLYDATVEEPIWLEDLPEDVESGGGPDIDSDTSPTITREIGGSYWSQPALYTILSALSSDTRAEFQRALGNLEGQVAAGTAVVKIAEPSGAPGPGTSHPTTEEHV
jgi:hypothetical protein